MTLIKKRDGQGAPNDLLIKNNQKTWRTRGNKWAFRCLDIFQRKHPKYKNYCHRHLVQVQETVRCQFCFNHCSCHGQSEEIIILMTIKQRLRVKYDDHSNDHHLYHDHECHLHRWISSFQKIPAIFIIVIIVIIVTIVSIDTTVISRKKVGSWDPGSKSVFGPN